MLDHSPSLTNLTVKTTLATCKLSPIRPLGSQARDGSAAASVRGAAGKPCADFSLLGDVCVEMGGMDKCANYDKLCAANSTVAELSLIHI